jgi:hypothetical protein
MAVTIPIISEFDGRGIKRAIEEFKSLETTGEKAKFALSKAAVPAAAALAGLAAAAGVSAKAAMEDQKQQQELARTIQMSTLATGEQIKTNEKFIAQMERQYAISDGELRPALANLVRGTGELEYSQELLGIAMDISAATGKDLGSVTEALSKAYAGNTKALRTLDPSLTMLIKSGATTDEMFQALAHTFQGAAATSANSLEGQTKKLTIALDNAKENIGFALLPVVEALLPVLDKMAQFVQDNTHVVVILGAAIGGLAASVLAINAALKIYQATLVVVKIAQAALNFVMSANPIGLVIIGIAALVAAFVILEKKFGIVSMAVQWLGEQFYKWIINPLKTIIDLASRAAAAVGKIAGGIGGAITKVIPGLADGGIVTSPTLAMIGEGGEPEAVIPLSQLDRYGGGGGINITINSTVADDRLGDVIVNALRQYNRRSGPINVAVS